MQTDELFTAPESRPSDLELARRRLARAETELEKARQLVDDQGPEAEPVLELADSELSLAQSALRIEETRTYNRNAKLAATPPNVRALAQPGKENSTEGDK